MRKVCTNCGTEFDGRPDSVLCPACAAESIANVIRDRVCRECGRTFPGGPRAWYCPECRRERKGQQSRECKERARTGKTRKLGSVDICIICGRPYVVEAGTQKYCPDCAPEAIAALDRAQSIEWNRKNVDYAARREQRNQATAAIPCLVCGKMFVPRSAAKTCSKECSAELSRRNARKFEASHREERARYHKDLRKKKLSSIKDDELKAPQETIDRKAEGDNS